MTARVDVFDPTFQRVRTTGGFTDPQIPSGYAPFGISFINAEVYVTYARQNADKKDHLRGAGHGFIDILDTRGNLVK